MRDIRNEVEAALQNDSAEFHRAMTALAYQLKSEGSSKQDIYDAHYRILQTYHETLPDAEYEVVWEKYAEHLDVFVGWCAPGCRIFPDEPDCK